MSKNFALPFDYLLFGGSNVLIGATVFLTDDGVDGQLFWSVDDAGSPTLIRKVDPGSSDAGSAFDPGPVGTIRSSSTSTVSSGLYTVYDGTLGQQLWKSDGSVGGTNLVLTLDAGPGAKNAEFSFSQAGNAVFATDDGVHGQKIWFTDGTSAGTALLATANTGTEPAGSEFDPAGIGYSTAAFTGPYLFVLYDKTLGQQLWSSDGTISGTTVVTDLETGPGIKSVAPFSTTITIGAGPSDWRDVFVSDDGVHGQQIWSTNGTSGNTGVLATVDSGTEPLDGSIDPAALAPSIAGASFASGNAAFVLYNKTLGQQLWTSDGTTAHLVLTLNSGVGIKNNATLSFSVNGKSVFATDDGVHGQKLWVSDGSGAGTTVLTTANSGTEAAGSEFVPSVIGYAISGGVLDTTRGLYVLYDQALGQQLWVTDGTQNGTHLLANLEGGPGIKSFATQALSVSSVNVSPTQVFAVDDGVHGQQIWSSDGSAGGTHMLASVPSVAVSTGPDHDPVILGGGTKTGLSDGSRVFFSLEDGQELWSTDGSAAGTKLVDTLPCFVAGTLIATPRGEVPVEHIAIGDLVTTQVGAMRPVRWIGHRHIDLTRHPMPEQAQPIRICAGAFAADAPARDLFLSPDHAVYASDVLIPIKHLINGCTIAQEPRDEVTYFHIELEQHDVLLAEGLPTESYLDTGDRSNFENGGGPVRLYPDHSARMWEAKGCAPLVVTGPALTSVRTRLLQRAAQLAVEPSRNSSSFRKSRAA
jgi:ELWxxDGT repeat protein